MNSRSRALSLFAAGIALAGFACLAQSASAPLAPSRADLFSGRARMHAAGEAPGRAVVTGVSDGAGGFYAVHELFSAGVFSGAGASVGAQLSIRENRVVRVTSAGAVAAGWPAEGIAPASGPANTSTTLLVSDGAGGVIVVWDEALNLELRVHAQRMNSAGARLWGANGVLVASGTGYRYLESAIADGAGGVLIGWQESGADPSYVESDLVVQRLTSAGAVASGWSAGGVALCSATGGQMDLRLASDGSGGLIACWYDGRGFNPDAFMQHVDASGVAQWSPDGISAGMYPPADIASDGAAGAFLCSVTGGFVVAQRFDDAGSALWTPGGIPVSTGFSYLVDPRVIEDGAGGALVHWLTQTFIPPSAGMLLAKRLTSTGATSAGWPADGLFVGDSLSAFGSRHAAERDGSGGFLFAWTDWREGVVPLPAGDTLSTYLFRPRAKRVTGAGAISAGWPGEGVRVSQNEAQLTGFEMFFTGDGAGGASFAWQDVRSGLFGQRLNGSGVKQWNAVDERIVPGPLGQTTPAIHADGAGGALVGWMEFAPGPSSVFVRRLDSTGALTSAKTPLGPPRGYLSTRMTPDGSGGTILAWLGFPAAYVERFDASGAAVWDSAAQVDPFNGGVAVLEGIASDGAGGVFLMWLDGFYNPTLQRIGADGVSSWSSMQPFGDVSYTFGFDGALVPDGAGGVIAIQQKANDTGTGTFSNIWIQRVDASGAPQWGAAGMALAPGARNQEFVRAASDGAGGVILTWNGDEIFTSADIWALRVDGTGAVASGWPPGGVLVCGESDRQLLPDIVGDGSGGSIIAWTDARGAIPQVYAQSLSGNGAPQWSADGIPLGPGGGAQYFQQLVSDGAEGAIANWIDARGPAWGVRGQRVNTLGALEWGAGGLDVGGSGGPSPDPIVFGAVASGNQFAPVFASDGFGGAFVAWQEAATPFEFEIRAQKITNGGLLAWSGGVTGTLASLVSASASPGLARLEWWSASGTPARLDRARHSGEWSAVATIHPDGGGRYVFEDHDVAPGGRYGYRLALPTASGEAIAGEVWLTVPAQDALAFAGAFPNPATDDVSMAFTLRGSGRAALEIFDLGGRRLISRDLEKLGAGSHRLRVARAGELKPGVYLARVREGEESRLQRFAVIR